MRHTLSLFIVVSLLSQSAFSGGNSAGFFGNARNVIALGIAAFMGRGDQQLFDAVRIRYQAVMQAAPAERPAALDALAIAHRRYVEFVTRHGGNMAAQNPAQVNAWLAEAQVPEPVPSTPNSPNLVDQVAEEVVARLSAGTRVTQESIEPRFNELLEEFRNAQNPETRENTVGEMRTLLRDLNIEIKAAKKGATTRYSASTNDPNGLPFLNKLTDLFNENYTKKRAREK